jgi:ATP-dependent protease HslVU (ClpYQ) peptidase subunit
MTCIVGITDGLTTWIGGDSAGVAGSLIQVRSDPKVFRNGQFLIGYTTSFRMGQLLQYSFSAPVPDEADVKDMHRFMCTKFVNALRECLKEGGWAEEEKGQECGGTFLVGWEGFLFEVNSDYQVGEHQDGYAAVGSGDRFALGSLHTTRYDTAGIRGRIESALAAAEYFSTGVCGPFTVMQTSQ